MSERKGSSIPLENCHTEHQKIDWLYWICLTLVLLFSADYHLEFIPPGSWSRFSDAVWELIQTMWWGILLGIIFVGLLSHVPRSAVMKLFGSRGDLKGILRATLAGVVLDLCSHGILMVGAKLYERGMTLGQLMAFLIASPWNSFSLTIILVSLIGLQWTVVFVLMSAIIAIISGLVFEKLVRMEVLPSNPSHEKLSEDVSFRSLFRNLLKGIQNPKSWSEVIRIGFIEGKMIIRWLLLGVLIASTIKTWVNTEDLQYWVGPTLFGLMMTLVFATVIEVCSEGLAPVAAEILNRAIAPGNAFAFLMTGVSTDYTEIMIIRQATKSWKVALFLPLVTTPQIILVAYWMNGLF